MLLIGNVRYSKFYHDNYGITNNYGAGGAIHVDHSLFEYNFIDAAFGNGSTQSYTYNTSYHSESFLSGSPYGGLETLIGNTIIAPSASPINARSYGPLTLVNNAIQGSFPYLVAVSGCSSCNSKIGYITSYGNRYAAATPFFNQGVLYGIGTATGGVTSINDASVDGNSINASLPTMPGALPNYHRVIYEVPQGSNADAIQTIINQAITENNWNKPVVHIPWGQYSINKTIVIPGNSDVQIVGDNMQTRT